MIFMFRFYLSHIVISTLVFFIIFNFVNVHGKPVSSGNNNQTCPKKQEIELLPGNIDVDMGSLSWMVSNKSVSLHPSRISQHNKNTKSTRPPLTTATKQQ